MPKIASLAEYMSTVSEVCKQWPRLMHNSTTHPWFRGQGDAAWDITPGLYRGHTNPDYERELVRDFRLRSTAYLSTVPHSDLELLFVMQHHGMPTRLLDWTESHMSALYFAVVNFQQTADALVWILDPWSLNEFSIQQRSVPTVYDPQLKDYILPAEPNNFYCKVKAQWPVAVRPCHGTVRIVAQRGMFTLHGYEQDGLRSIAATYNANATFKIELDKIIIDGSQKKSIMRELYMAGVTQATVFPDLDGLSREICFRYSKMYLS